MNWRIAGEPARSAAYTACSCSGAATDHSGSTRSSLPIARPWRHRNSGSTPIPKLAAVLACTSAGSLTCSAGRRPDLLLFAVARVAAAIAPQAQCPWRRRRRRRSLE